MSPREHLVICDKLQLAMHSMQRRISYFASTVISVCVSLSASVSPELHSLIDNLCTLIFFLLLYYSVKIFAEDGELHAATLREFSQKITPCHKLP